MAAAAGHEPLEYPRCQGEMLVLQQHPGPQYFAEELQVCTADFLIGLIVVNQIAQLCPEIEMRAWLPAPSMPGE